MPLPGSIYRKEKLTGRWGGRRSDLPLLLHDPTRKIITQLLPAKDRL